MTSLLTDIRVKQVALVLDPAIRKNIVLFKSKRDKLERINLFTAVEKGDEPPDKLADIKQRFGQLAETLKSAGATDAEVNKVMRAILIPTSEELQTQQEESLPVDKIQKCETLLFPTGQLSEFQKSARSASVSKSDDGELPLIQEASFHDNSDADKLMAHNPTLSRVQALAQVRGSAVGKARTALALNALLGPMPKSKALRKANDDYHSWLERVLHIAEFGS